MLRSSAVVYGALLFCTGCMQTSSPTSVTSEPIAMSGLYTVATYDPARSASADLEATVRRASAENKRILIEVGGDW